MLRFLKLVRWLEAGLFVGAPLLLLGFFVMLYASDHNPATLAVLVVGSAAYGALWFGDDGPPPLFRKPRNPATQGEPMSTNSTPNSSAAARRLELLMESGLVSMAAQSMENAAVNATVQAVVSGSEEEVLAGLELLREVKRSTDAMLGFLGRSGIV